MKLIASCDNPHFKALRKLCQSGRERRKRGQIVLDGIHLIDSYQAKFGEPAELLLSESGLQNAEIANWLNQHDPNTCPPTVLSDALFAELSVVDTPSGIMAVASRPHASALPDARRDAVLLDGVQDPGNVGSILRSAAAAGFRQVLLSTDCAQVWSPRTLRAAMGAHFLLDIHEGVDLPAFLSSYGGQRLVTSLEARSSLYAVSLQEPLAWIFGSEGQGVREEVSRHASLCLKIPMAGATESLNVAAAAAVCLFETMRQRLLPLPASHDRA